MNHSCLMQGFVYSAPFFGVCILSGTVRIVVLMGCDFIIDVGAPKTDPKTITRNGTNLLDETDLHPLVPVAVPGAHHIGGADVSLNLEVGVDFSNPTAPKYTLGGTVGAFLYLTSGLAN